MPRLTLALVVGLASFGPAAAGPAAGPKPLEWRVLLIVKARGDIRADGLPDVKYEMTGPDVAAAKEAFTRFTPAFVQTLSRGRAVWKPEVVISQTPLRKVAKLDDGTWVAPECVDADLAALAPAGKFDGVFVYWKDTDDRTKRSLSGCVGRTHAAAGGYNGTGYSCVNYVPARDLGRESEGTEVFLREWLHQIEAFYGGKGVKLPRGGLNGQDNYDFRHQNGWKHWYEAFIRGDLTERDGTKVGLGEAAWRHGTIRDDQAVRLPEYLSPDRRRGNLLADASFEDGAKAWTPRSWRGAKGISALTVDVRKAGKAAIVLRSAVADDAMLWQKVMVKPKTRYLLSAWARTEKVVIEEQGGTVGANLAVAGGYEASNSLVGTKGWTYLALVFGSGDRTAVEVGPRLGLHGSTASGAAWFDDLVLIELPEVIK